MTAPDPAVATFGANLGRLRHEAKLSQKRLAAMAGIHPSTLSLIELGSHGPGLATAVALAQALGTDVTSMLTEETEPAP